MFSFHYIHKVKFTINHLYFVQITRLNDKMQKLNTQKKNRYSIKKKKNWISCVLSSIGIDIHWMTLLNWPNTYTLHHICVKYKFSKVKLLQSVCMCGCVCIDFIVKQSKNGTYLQKAKFHYIFSTREKSMKDCYSAYFNNRFIIKAVNFTD